MNEDKDILFSIITVVYNSENLIERTIQSVKNQTYCNYEYIIIDGNSNDNTLKIISSYSEVVDNLVSEKDSGIYDAMNKGIRLSKGKYLIFLNAGDVFCHDSILENISLHIKSQNNPLIVYGGNEVYNENEEFIKALKPLKLNKANLNMFGTRTVCHQAIFVHKDIMKFYETKYMLKGELNWYFDILENIDNARIACVDFSICNYYLGGTGDRNFWKNYFENIIVVKNKNIFFIFIFILPFFLIPILFKLKHFLAKQINK